MKIRQFEFNMFGVNTYVAWDTATLDAVVIDPGMIDDNECRRLDSFIAERGLKLTRMLFTHLHLDHTFGSDYIATHYGLKAEGHEADGFLGEQRASQAAMFHINREMTSLKLDRFISEGSIAVGDDCLEVLHVPGHSPGSVAYYNRSGGWVVTGDALFKGSIGRTDLPGGNHSELVGAIRKKLLTLPEETVVLPGHGPATTIAEELRSNIFIR